MKKSSPNKNPRRNARRHAMQAIYSWQVSPLPRYQLIEQFVDEHKMKRTNIEYFKRLVEGVLKEIESIDAVLIPQLDRDINELSPVELAILRLASYEFKYCVDVPYRVIINEALEVNKEFGAEEGYRYVNGVLDALAKVLRHVEVKAYESR